MFNKTKGFFLIYFFFLYNGGKILLFVHEYWREKRAVIHIFLYVTAKFRKYRVDFTKRKSKALVSFKTYIQICGS
jgi:hypothetical protein